ncbi:hypothetical protein [Neobacillus soli]|uniref:hypothetical protein n=1 Tax=Neobacillus soli TaxID=220688 RepID=UPI0008259CFA|nr:hypothetical protein [Neobacillus soli]
MIKKKSLIFIGERGCNQQLIITKKPSFYDAVTLSNQSPQPTKNTPYRSIPLVSSTNISFRNSDYNIQLTSQSIQISESGRELSEEEVFDMLNHLIIKEGDKVTFFGYSPYCKNRPRKKKELLVLAAGRKLEGE